MTTTSLRTERTTTLRTERTTAPLTVTRALLATIVLVTAIAPLATDMYVPAFPEVGAALRASASEVQLTLTTFFVGVALGQLLGGPFSDAHGRRHPLLAALAVLTVASVACAVSPTTGVLMVARFLQGFSGGMAMVVARSVVVDLSDGDDLVRRLNLVAGVSGVAPILGPLAGAAILQFSEWRVSFWAVGVLGALMIAGVAVAIPETLSTEHRHDSGLSQLGRAARVVLGHRAFVGYLATFALSMGAIFAYVSTSAFVLQSMNGLSPAVYSIDFAANAVGLTLTTLLSARLAGRVSTRAVVVTGALMSIAAGVLLLVGALCWDMPLVVAVIGFFVLMGAQGLVGPNAGALASAEVPDHPGTGSAVLGFTQWCAAGIVAPLAGLGGEATAVPMAVIIVVLGAASMVALIGLTRSRSAAPTMVSSR